MDRSWGPQAAPFRMTQCRGAAGLSTSTSLRFAQDDGRKGKRSRSFTPPTPRTFVHGAPKRSVQDDTPSLLAGFGEFVGFGEPLAAFVHAALGVVVGLDGEAVFVDGAVALAGDVEDFAERDMAPALGPARLAVAAQCVAIVVDGQPG